MCVLVHFNWTNKFGGNLGAINWLAEFCFKIEILILDLPSVNEMFYI